MSDTGGAETVSPHYGGGADGEEYFSYQQTDVERNNRIASRWFTPHVGPSDTVIDFGCGTGWLLKLLDAGEKLGIEPNPNARKYADDLGIKTVSSPAEIASDIADVVVSNHALEHSLAPYDELVSIHRILKPGGKLVLCLPIDDWRAQKKIDPQDPNHHLFTWTPLLLSNLLDEAGFDVQTASAFSFLQSPPSWKIDAIPAPIFDLVAKLHGRLMRYHQLVTVAKARS